MTRGRCREAAFAAAALAAIVAASACREGPPERRSARPSPAFPPSAAFALADSLRVGGREAAALPRYAVLRDSFSRAGDSASWWRAELWLAQGYLAGGKRDSGLTALQTAAALAGGNADRRGWTHYMRSIFLDRVGRFDSAFAEADAARDISTRTGDPRLEAAAYHAMGRIYSLSGRYRQALASNQRALTLQRSYGASLRESSVELSELGIDYRHLGRFTDAVAAYDSALAAERMLANPEGIARVEFNLANVRMATGDDREALRLMDDALSRAEQIGELRGMAFIHGGLAELYTRARAYGAAREHYERALAINQTARLPYGEVQNLEGLGRVMLAEGKVREAAPLLSRALALADSAPFGKERATVRAALSRASAASGSPGRARRWASAAVRIADSLGDPAVEVEARAARAVALEASRDREAPAAYLSAIDVLESWRGRLALGDLRMGLADSHLDLYEGAIRTLLTAGRVEDAFEVAERARARTLIELMSEHDVHDRPRTYEDQVRLALREQFESGAEAVPSARPAIDRSIDSLTGVLDSLERSARGDAARAGVSHPAPVTPGRLRDGLLTPDRGLLMYFWGERDVYGWWVARETMHGRRLGTADSLAALADFLRGSLIGGAGGPEWRPPAAEAYARFVAPLAPSPASEVLVVADGPLAFVPFEALLPAERQPPWGGTARFTYGPSASVLLALSAPATTHPTRGALAIGNPTVAADSSASDDETREGSGTLPELPAAATEARDVVRMMGGDVLTGDRATVDRWLALDPGRYRYLHFATHALLDDAHPERSALLLADGRLDLQAIRQLRLTADLVTLSACETGLGRRVRGEGIIGLPYAFLEAGARAVIVSLWRVRDQETARFMSEYYTALRAGHSPADAMLRVRQARLREPGARPADWAGFVLLGASDERR